MKIKKYISNCLEHSKKYASSWDYYCLAADSYLAGFRDVTDNTEEVEYEEPKDGKHQLSETTFRLQKQENYKLPLESLLKTYIPMIDFTEIRVEEKDGVISFQGMGKRVKL